MISSKWRVVSVFEMILLVGLSFAVAGLVGDSIGVEGLGESLGRVSAKITLTPTNLPKYPDFMTINGKPTQGRLMFGDESIGGTQFNYPYFEKTDGTILKQNILDEWVSAKVPEGVDWKPAPIESSGAGADYIPPSPDRTVYTGEIFKPPVVDPSPGATGGLASIGDPKNVMVGDKIFEGTTVFKDPTTGLHYAKVPGEGAVVFDKTKDAWVATEEVPAGLTESGTLAKGGGTSGGATQPGILGSIFGGKLFGTEMAGTAGPWATAGGALVSGAVWGAMVGFGSFYIAKMMGQTEKQAASIGMGLGTGTFVGSSLYLMGANSPTIMAQSPFLFSATGGLLIGAGVAATIIILTYKKEKKEIVQFQCLPWEAPIGGRNCEDCNKDPLLPCSEYRCKSLGQACEIVNAGSENEMCVWVHPDDTSAPIISPWEDALRPKDELRYVKDTAVRPPARGAKIMKLGEFEGCLQAYTQLQFGVTTNEPAKCKISLEVTDSFDNMTNFMDNDNSFMYNHTQNLKVPSPFTEEGDANEIPEIHNDGTYTLYVRCADANNNWNIDAFSFRYCVQDGPDTTQPKIVGANIPDGSPVQFGVDTIAGLEIYVNEPAECRWSRIDKAFSDMENTMDCSTESYQINADLNYVCSGTLTGIKDRENNQFYFRCMDYATPNRNVMPKSYPLTLKGTEELVITSTGPSGTFEGSTSIATIYLTAETAHGADEGKATCYFDTAAYGDFDIAMEFSDSYMHNQSLDLGAGDYNFYFKCVDDGGNAAYADTNFTIKIDRVVPTVARVYRELDTLTVVTDEQAKCAYSLTSCDYNFDEGVAMVYEDATERTVHYAEWDTDATFYIKCADLQGNEPAPTACSIIAKGSEL